MQLDVRLRMESPDNNEQIKKRHKCPRELFMQISVIESQLPDLTLKSPFCNGPATRSAACQGHATLPSGYERTPIHKGMRLSYMMRVPLRYHIAAKAVGCWGRSRSRPVVCIAPAVRAGMRRLAIRARVIGIARVLAGMLPMVLGRVAGRSVV